MVDRYNLLVRKIVSKLVEEDVGSWILDEISWIISLDFIVTELLQVSIYSSTNNDTLWNESFESPDISSEIRINDY